jgi:transposase
MHHYQAVLAQMRSGKSDRQIALLGLMGRHKCQELRLLALDRGWLEGELPSTAQLHDLLSSKASPSVPSGVEQYRDKVLAWVADGVAGTTIFTALKREGFAGSYSSVRRFVQRLPRLPQVTVPLDFGPGESAQVDFGAGPALVEAGRRIKTWVFVMVLSFSRLLYAELVRDQSVATWLGCHRRAFGFFGGVTAAVRIDNAKCAITKACATDPLVQRAYAELALAAGFRVDACPPRTPQLKGRVERGVGYVTQAFFPTRTLDTLESINADLLQWCRTEAGERIHGTTRERPNARFERERDLLLPVPDRWPELCSYVQAKVHRDCHVQVASALYSVPWSHVGQTLTVKLGERLVEIFDHTHQVIAAHLKAARGTRRTDASHLPLAAQAFFARDRRALSAAAVAIGPHCSELLERLLGDAVVDRLRAAQGVIRLAERHGAKALEAACARALAFGHNDYRTVKGILKNAAACLTEAIALPATGSVYQGSSRFAPTRH